MLNCILHLLHLAAPQRAPHGNTLVLDGQQEPCDSDCLPAASVVRDGPFNLLGGWSRSNYSLKVWPSDDPVNFTLPGGFYTSTSPSLYVSIPVDKDNPLMVERNETLMQELQKEVPQIFPISQAVSDESGSRCLFDCTMKIYQCDAVWRWLPLVGVNGIHELLPAWFWHHAGPTLVDYARGRNLVTGDDAFYLTQATQLSLAGYGEPEFASGYMHSMMWYDITTRNRASAPIDWNGLLHDYCRYDHVAPVLFFDCLHGIGHSVMIRHMYNVTNPADFVSCTGVVKEKSLTPDRMQKAEASCESAPTNEMRYGCAMGMYHSYQVNGGRLIVQGADILYPCATARRASVCYHWNVLQTVNVPTRKNAVSSMHELRDFCLKDDDRTEHNRRGCIFGVAGHFFPLYDLMFNSRLQLPTPVIEACQKGFTMAPNYIYDFEKHTSSRQYCLPLTTPTIAHTNSTLINWCTTMTGVATTPQRKLDKPEYLRWLACAVGTVHWSLHYHLGIHTVPEALIIERCEEFLFDAAFFMADRRQRQIAFDVCKHRALYQRTPTTWDDLSWWDAYVLDLDQPDHESQEEAAKLLGDMFDDGTAP